MVWNHPFARLYVLGMKSEGEAIVDETEEIEINASKGLSNEKDMEMSERLIMSY